MSTQAFEVPVLGQLYQAFDAMLNAGMRAAVYVEKSLRGVSAATLPVESPGQYELVINLSTARAFGLTIPPFLLRADQVIE